jgi:hypothetical protein
VLTRVQRSANSSEATKARAPHGRCDQRLDGVDIPLVSLSVRCPQCPTAAGVVSRPASTTQMTAAIDLALEGRKDRRWRRRGVTGARGPGGRRASRHWARRTLLRAWVNSFERDRHRLAHRRCEAADAQSEPSAPGPILWAFRFHRPREPRAGLRHVADADIEADGDGEVQDLRASQRLGEQGPSGTGSDERRSRVSAIRRRARPLRLQWVSCCGLVIP